MLLLNTKDPVTPLAMFIVWTGSSLDSRAARSQRSEFLQSRRWSIQRPKRIARRFGIREIQDGFHTFKKGLWDRRSVILNIHLSFSTCEFHGYGTSKWRQGEGSLWPIYRGSPSEERHNSFHKTWVVLRSWWSQNWSTTPPPRHPLLLWNQKIVARISNSQYSIRRKHSTVSQTESLGFARWLFLRSFRSKISNEGTFLIQSLKAR
jgi:hypothetical protein